MNRIFGKLSAVRFLESALKFVNRPTKIAGKGVNIHKSNRAKKGGFFYWRDI